MEKLYILLDNIIFYIVILFLLLFSSYSLSSSSLSFNKTLSKTNNDQTVTFMIDLLRPLRHYYPQIDHANSAGIEQCFDAILNEHTIPLFAFNITIGDIVIEYYVNVFFCVRIFFIIIIIISLIIIFDLFTFSYCLSHLECPSRSCGE